jgi:hypothetical protein
VINIKITWSKQLLFAVDSLMNNNKFIWLDLRINKIKNIRVSAGLKSLKNVLINHNPDLNPDSNKIVEELKSRGVGVY